jgi:hypothetical protein
MTLARFLLIESLDYELDLVEHHERCGCLYGRRAGHGGMFILRCPKHRALEAVLNPQAALPYPIYTRFSPERRMICAEPDCHGDITGFASGLVGLDFYEMDAYRGLCPKHLSALGVIGGLSDDVKKLLEGKKAT